VYPPSREAPYNREELEEARLFIARLLSVQDERRGALSQNDLALELERSGQDANAASDLYSAFLDSGICAWSKGESFREGDSFTVDAILDGDLDEYTRLRAAKNPQARGLVVPVPKKFARKEPRLGRRLCVAPSENYSVELGFMNEGENG
jgi:hypothetical protein